MAALVVRFRFPEGDGLQFVGRTPWNGFAHLTVFLGTAILNWCVGMTQSFESEPNAPLFEASFEPSRRFRNSIRPRCSVSAGIASARNRPRYSPDLPEGTRFWLTCGAMLVGRKVCMLISQPYRPLALTCRVQPARPAVTAGHQIGDPILVTSPADEGQIFAHCVSGSAGSAAHGSSERPENPR